MINSIKKIVKQHRGNGCFRVTLSSIFLCCVLVQHVEARINIEQVQREFQARFNYDTKGNYVVWPSSKCGSPAPLYPPDGFYGDLDKDPEFAAYLVSDLCGQFYGGYYPLYVTGDNQFDRNSGEPLWSQFLKNNIIEGQPNPPDNFDWADFPITGAGFDLLAVTVVNHPICFYKVRGYVEKLYYTWADAGFTPLKANLLDEGRGGYTSTNSCEEAELVARTSFARAWDPYLERPPTRIGIAVSSTSACNSDPPMWSAAITSVQGQTIFNPTFVPGTVTLYATASLCYQCDPGGTPGPPIALDGTFHSIDSAAVDGVNEVKGKTFCTETPNFTVHCVSNCDSPKSQGWSMGMAFGILAPIFDTTPDGPLNPEDSGSPGSSGPTPCTSCNAEAFPGHVTANTTDTGIDVQISLGPDQYGNSAGYFRLNTSSIFPSIYGSSALQCLVSPNVTLNSSVNPTLVTTANYIASIVSGGTGYTIYFTNQNVIPPQFASSVTVSSNYNQIQFSEVLGSGGTPRVLQCNYTNPSPSNSSWTMVEGAGLRTQTRTTTWPTSTNRIDTTIISSSGGLIASQITQQYQVVPWGLALLQRTVGTGALAKVTTWTYYTATDGPTNIGQLKQIVEPSGRWERYQYDFAGRLTNTVSQFKDNLSTTSDNANRATLIGYDDAHGIITNIQKLLGTEISRSYLVHSVSGTVKKEQEIRCTVTNAPINSFGNLTNIVWRDTNTSETTQSLNVDGTMSFYTYATNTSTGEKTITVTEGAPDASQTFIVDGTRTVTVIGSAGQLLSRSVYDILSTLLIEQQIYTYTDPLNRSHTVHYLDGTTQTFNYLCCGLDSQIDRDGVTTQYTYDAMKRQVATTRLGITTSNILDAVGHTLATVRIGTDRSTITLKSARFGIDGTQLTETNGLGGVTHLGRSTNTLGQTLVCATNADGGVRITTYYQDGSILNATNTAAHPLLYVYGCDSDGAYSTEIKVSDTGGTNEWTKTSLDAAGRAWKISYPGGAASRSYYNNLGQMTNAVDPDGLMKLSAFDRRGNPAYAVVDMNTNGIIDLASDRITFTLTDITSDFGTTVRRSRIYAWSTNGSAVSNLVSMSEVSVDGLRSWNTTYRDASTPVVTKSQTFYAGGGSRYVTNTAADGAYSIMAYLNGRLSSVTQKDALNNQLSSLTYTYDSHGRQSAITDARTGMTSYNYNPADLVSSVTTPGPGGMGGSPQTTYTYYNLMLQATNVVQPDGTCVASTFLPTGELSTNYGSRLFPVAYTYDYAGRLKTMSTWKNFSGRSGQAVTTWNYDANRGFLTGKTYDGGAAGPSYTYTAAGRLKTRSWARGITATYSYDNGGSLISIQYSDGTTPNVTNTFDRLGRESTIACKGMTNTLSYNTASEMLSESFTGGTLAGLAVTNAYDAYLRKSAVALSNQTTSLVRYGYDNSGRLQTVVNGNLTMAYAYLANTPLVSQISFTNSGTQRMVTTKTFDFLNRLTSISSSSSTAAQIAYSYLYNDANQRVRSTLADGSTWQYAYDSLGQVISGHKFFTDQTPMPGQQFDYSFDNIGNRTQTLIGGDQNGFNQRLALYTSDNLNKYSSRGVPGFVDIMGVALATNVVMVGGQTATRKGEYFRNQLPVNNSAAVWTNVVVSSPAQNPISGNTFVPQTPENFSYDSDGNLTGDGHWTYTWDAENRLISVQALASLPTAAKFKLDFCYDAKGRRIQKSVSTNNGSVYVPQSTNRFVYDGWNLVAILNSQSVVMQSFTWGLDLSGTIQGAGGVGGLLAINDASGTFLTTCDGNGNIAGLTKATDGTIAAQYEYGPFGELLRATGPMARANPFRFSTKYQDDETDLLYYGYRYYNASTGRWLSRDPAGEDEGGSNLYGFVANDPSTAVDELGLAVQVYTLSAGKQWSYGTYWGLGGANGLHVDITALSDGCTIDPAVFPKLKNRWFWHVFKDTTTSKTYDSDRNCKCGKVQCFKYTRSVTWQSNGLLPRPIPRIWHLYQTVTVDFTICADGVGNSASATGSQSGHNLDMFFTLEDF